jgi:hypothetical protein
MSKNTKGIFSRVTRTARTYDDILELLRECSAPSPEVYVRSNISKVMDIAIEVLRRAGHPTKEGRYRKQADGTFRLIENVEQTDLRSGIYFWPYFIPREPLTLEDFAVQLIHEARGLLESVERGHDIWSIASLVFHYSRAEFNFRLAIEGIADIASSGAASRRGTAKSAAKRMMSVTERQAAVKMSALKYLSRPGTSKKRSHKTVAAAIYEDIKRGFQGKASVETIRQDIMKLRKLGQIPV